MENKKLEDLQIENMNLQFENILLKKHLRESTPSTQKEVEQVKNPIATAGQFGGLGSGVNQKIKDYLGIK